MLFQLAEAASEVLMKSRNISVFETCLDAPSFALKYRFPYVCCHPRRGAYAEGILTATRSSNFILLLAYLKCIQSNHQVERTCLMRKGVHLTIWVNDTNSDEEYKLLEGTKLDY